MRRRKAAQSHNVDVVRAKTRPDARLLPTLLDRLRDDEPRTTVESPDAYAVSRAQMRDIIQRDLTYLLNTTNIEDQIDSQRYPEAAKSTVNFGMSPLAGGSLAALEWSKVEEMLRGVIEVFEPRLMRDSLVIRPLDAKAVAARRNVLSFEVSGEIQMDPYPLEFMVQSAFDLETSQMSITRAGTG